jgi:dehydrogenase/reductase SDR family member 1
MVENSKPLLGKVALVTGASRGIGKGAALGLGEAGATVYVTARTLSQHGAIPGTAEETAEEVSRLGGKGIALQCDHGIDSDVDAVVARIREEHGQLDLLVNCVYPAPAILPTAGPKMPGGKPFWETPAEGGWDAAFTIGVRGHYVMTQKAMPMLLESDGLIVNISSPGNYVYIMSTLYGAGKAANERMVQQMAEELEDTGVSIMTLWPGVVKTEVTGGAIEQDPEWLRAILALSWANFPDASERVAKMSGEELVALVETPTFTGRAIVALARSADRKRRSGHVFSNAGLAKELGFTDIDGRIPDGLRLLETSYWPPLADAS